MNLDPKSKNIISITVFNDTGNRNEIRLPLNSDIKKRTSLT